MLTISTDIMSLTQEQREALAGFILTFPASEEPIITMAEPVETYVEPDEEMSPEQAFAPPASGYTSVPAPIALVEPSNLDKHGLPWDERIHASSRAKTQDGAWRSKRGVDPTLVTTVEAELKALMGIPVPTQATTQMTPAPVAEVVALQQIPAPVTSPIPPPPVAPAAAVVASITSSPVVSAPIAVVPPPPASALNPFVDLITMASGAIGAGKLTQDEMQAACYSVGVPSLPLLANRLDLVPLVRASIEALIAGR
jgi:hypothetical protein